jgi:hypothetical protein
MFERVSNFSAISWREHVDDDVHLVLNQYALLFGLLYYWRSSKCQFYNLWFDLTVA